MTAWQKIPLGILCLGSGGALTIWSAAAILLAVTTTRQGLTLPYLLALVVGLFVLGASFDLLGRRRVTGKKQGILAKSVWADRAEIEACKIVETKKDFAGDGGIYLGEFTDSNGRKSRLRYGGTKSILCLGVPGSSKSMGLVAPQAHLRRSMVIIDPKVQLAPIMWRARNKLGKTYVANPYGVFSDKLPHLRSCGWSPLAHINLASPMANFLASKIAEAIVEKSSNHNESSKFFEESCENFIAAWCLWERYSKGDAANLCNIRADLTAPPRINPKTKKPESSFLHLVKQMALCTEHPAIARAGGQLYSRLTDKGSMNTSVQDVVATILQQTKFLDDPNIDADMTCGNRIDFGAFHREICTLWICLPTTRLEEQKKWLRLIMNIALTEMMEEAPTFDATLPPVLYLLDEFGNLGNLSQIKKALNMSRDLSIQIFALLQNLAQLTSAYPNDEWTSFWSGAGAKISFQTGDSKTNDELVKLFGNREEFVETQTANGVSVAPQSIRLINPEDISRLVPGETISVIEPCTMPIKGFAPVYPKTPWAESLDANPYYRGKS